MSIVRYLSCILLKRHRYYPCYEERWKEHAKGTKRRHIKARFECEHCGQKTKWLNQADTQIFLDEKAYWS